MGWNAFRVGDVGEVIVGQQKSRNKDGAAYPYLRVANVQDGFLDLTDVQEMMFSDNSRYVLENGDVLLCEGQSRELVGRAAIYRGELRPLRIQNSVIRFRSGPHVVPEYALHVFRSYQKSGVFARSSKATTGIAHLSLSRFKALPFPLPPLELQREIADTCGDVQILLDHVNEVIGSVEQTLMAIVPTAADTAILGDHSRTWSEGQSGTSPWPLRDASDVVHSDAPIVYGILKPGPHVEDGIPYVRGQDLQQWFVRTQNLLRCSPTVAVKYSRSSLRPDDVLLGIIRNTRVAVVPTELEGGNITQGTARFRAGDEIDPRYLAHWLSSRSAQAWLKGHMRGIDMPGLNLRDVRRLPVPLPPLEIQREIAGRLDALVGSADLLSQSVANGRGWTTALEGAALQSLAYGEAAAKVADQRRAVSASWIPTILIDNAEALPDSHVANVLAPGIVDDEAGSPRSDDIDASGREETVPVSIPVSGAQVVSTEELLEALDGLGGESTPEDLYARLGLSESGIDSFYIALRAAVTAGTVKHESATGVGRSLLARVYE
ncbi:restriction endonuclease subunit S [Micromonospora sp. NPDC047187]|uniref:restriction endonuclease subunit S n=1 Tax=Micromonospora sp. NPDC047187 TaxID=3155262 RepID=UPI0033E511DC